MKKAGLFATISVATTFVTASAFGQGFTELETSHDISKEIDQAITTACPDPTPATKSIEDIFNYKKCVDGTANGIHTVAIEVSNFITENKLRSDILLSAVVNHQSLVHCNTAIKDSYIPDAEFQPTVANLEQYGNDRINAVRACVDDIATVQDNTGHWYDQDGQDAVINQVNCFLTPDTCVRPIKPKPVEIAPAPNVI